MADQTTSSITIEADPAGIMAVIADFEAYPEWAKLIKRVEVLSTHPDGRAEQVFFVLDAGAIKDEYTLAYSWTDTECQWTLVEGKMLKAMDGAYTLAPTGDGATAVTYRLAVDLKIPDNGLIKRKAEKVIIDTALNGLKERVEG